MATPGEITALLRRLSRGDREAEKDLIPHVYQQLRNLAAKCLRAERPDHSMQATALIHEAYLRLAVQEGADWQDRAHFFAVASKIMRRVLVDHARQRLALRRGGNATRVEWNESLVVGSDQCDLVADLHEALDRLAEIAERAARVVEMRFFAGMTEEQIAVVLGVASRTVKRDWEFARAWLLGEMTS
jgi:RNA polymerase sigma-70 factor (ECF subfamily)